MPAPLAHWGSNTAFPATFAIAGLATVALLGILLPVLRRLQVGQRVRDDGPERHLSKGGTPTMGGAAMVVVVVAMVLFLLPRDPAVIAVTVATVLAGALGFADDYLKVALNRPLGLKGRTKISAQVVLGAALGAFVAYGVGRGTIIAAPGGLFYWDLGPAYPVFGALVMAGTTNAVNLTDGLDGLAAGSVALAMPVFVLAAMAAGQTPVALLGLAFLGATVGFLWHNFHPARVFMGDTGSLALGAALASMAMVTGTEIVLILAGGLFVLETLSVVIQVVYFRRTGGRRLLKMAPLHHHLELSGLPEVWVVLSLWGVQAFCVLVAIWTLRGMGL